jgi:hypothetical protein
VETFLKECRFSLFFILFIIPVYLQSVQVHSVNWLKEVDECLGEERSLALFYELNVDQQYVAVNTVTDSVVSLTRLSITNISLANVRSNIQRL